MKKEHVVVVGAGVAGLSLAFLLLKRGYNVTVLERERKVGGLARSFRYGDYTFDIGPHRFHTDRKDVMRFIEFVLGKDALAIDRMSSVYLFKKYHTWPLRPRTLIRLPLSVLIKSGIDLFLRPKFRSESFKDYILSKYGKTLYNVFFKDYTEKFIFTPPAKLHFTWAAASVDRAVIDKKLKMNSLIDTLIVTLMPKPVETKFLYPKKGCDVFASNLVKLIKKEGGKIVTSVKDVKVSHKDNMITSVKFGKKRIKVDKLVWTASLLNITSQLDLEVPKLKYLKTLVYNIEINRDLKNPNQWIYFGDKGTVFCRISLPKNFSPYSVPRFKDGLCVEVTAESGEYWDKPDLLIPRIIMDLVKTKMCRIEDIGRIHIEKIEETYPVYAIDYPEELKSARDNLSKFSNLYCTGRTGAFYYNNMDNSIEMVLKLAEQFPMVKK